MQPLVIDRWFRQWLNRRLPPQKSTLLSRKNVFIFPSKAGFLFLSLTALLWLIATNYENNLIFGLSFLLASLFVVSILHTHSNLSGLTVTAIGSKPVFAGEDAEFDLMLTGGDQAHYENVLLSWPGEAPQIVNLTDQKQHTIKLYIKTDQRGLFSPPRLLIETCYPLGLLRAWSWLKLDMTCLVYPRPIQPGPVPAAVGASEEGELSETAGSEDFYGLKPYHTGDALKHVAWKQFAKGRGMYTKEYLASSDRQLWLDWDYLAGMNRESRLSRLCFWVLAASRTQQPYGLRLPNLEIPPNKGPAHRDHLLKTLALFEIDIAGQ